MTRIGLVIAGALVVGALAMACGGDEDTPTPSPTPTTAAPTPTEATGGGAATAAPSPTATATPTVSATPSTTATPTATSTPSPTATEAGGGGETRQAPIAEFTLPTLTIEAGTTVVWQNTDGVPHTATADDGSFDSGSLQGATTFSHTFEEAGTFSYFCEVHPSMTGTITVN